MRHKRNWTDCLDNHHIDTVNHEIYENQRFFAKWKKPFLPSDYAHWTDGYGKKRRKPKLLRLIPDGCWEWNADWMVSDWSYAKNFKPDADWGPKKGRHVRRRCWRRTRIRINDSNNYGPYVFEVDIHHGNLKLPLNSPLNSPDNSLPGSPQNSPPPSPRASPHLPFRNSPKIPSRKNSNESAPSTPGKKRRSLFNFRQNSGSRLSRQTSDSYSQDEAKYAHGFKDELLPPPSPRSPFGRRHRRSSSVSSRGSLSARSSSESPAHSDSECSHSRGLSDEHFDLKHEDSGELGGCVIEETFENQRYLRSWSQTGSIPKDPPPWANKSGSAARPRNSFKLPVCDEPDSAWTWATPWLLDYSQPCDEDGWSYGARFKKRSKLTDRRPKKKSIVRRRRWLRARIMEVKPTYQKLRRQNLFAALGDELSVYAVLYEVLRNIAWHIHWMKEPTSDLQECYERPKRLSRLLRSLSFETEDRIDLEKNDMPSSGSNSEIHDLIENVTEIFDCLTPLFVSCFNSDLEHRYELNQAKTLENRFIYICQLICDSRSNDAPERVIMARTLQCLFEIVAKTSSSQTDLSVLDVIQTMQEEHKQFSKSVCVTGVITLDVIGLLRNILDSLTQYDKATVNLRRQSSWEGFLHEEIDYMEVLPELFDQLTFWLVPYHRNSPDIVTELFKIRIKMGVKTAPNNRPYNVKEDIGQIIVQSATQLYEQCRRYCSIGPNHTHDPASSKWWKQSDWKTFGEKFMDAARIDVETFVKKFETINVLFYPAQHSLGTLALLFCKDALEFFEASKEKGMELDVIAAMETCYSVRTFYVSKADFFVKKKFDQILDLLPPVDDEIRRRVGKWISEEFQQIRSWIEKSVQQEKWEALDFECFNSTSVVDVYTYLFSFQKTFLKRLRECPAMARIAVKDEYVFAIRTLISEYCTYVTQEIGILDNLMRNLTRKEQVAVRGAFSSLIHKVTDYASDDDSDDRDNFDDDILGIEELCVRLSNLSKVTQNLGKLGKDLVRGWRELQALKPLKEDDEKGFELTEDVFTSFEQLILVHSTDISRMIGHRVVYIELNQLLIDKLYSKTGESSVQGTLIGELGGLIDFVKQCVAGEDFVPIVQDIFHVFLQAYEWVLTRSERMFDMPNTATLRSDLKCIYKLFGEILEIDQMQCTQATKVEMLLDLMETSSEDLYLMIERNEDENESKERFSDDQMLGLRVLSRRKSKPERRFAESYSIKCPYLKEDKLVKANSLKISKDHKYVLDVTVICGEELKAADESGTSDPYVVVKYGEQSQKTKYIRKELNPVWDQMFRFGYDPDGNSTVNFLVYDKDLVSADDFLGDAEIDVKGADVLQGQPFWVDLGNSDNLFEALGKIRIKINTSKIEM